MIPAFRSASIAICLPGNASRVKRAVTSAVRTAPWLTTMYWIAISAAKQNEADYVIPSNHELPKGLNNMSGRCRAFIAVQ